MTQNIYTAITAASNLKKICSTLASETSNLSEANSLYLAEDEMVKIIKKLQKIEAQTTTIPDIEKPESNIDWDDLTPVN